MAEIATLIRQASPDLTLDGGDMFTGTMLNDELKGKPLIEVEASWLSGCGARQSQIRLRYRCLSAAGAGSLISDTVRKCGHRFRRCEAIYDIEREGREGGSDRIDCRIARGINPSKES